MKDRREEGKERKKAAGVWGEGEEGGEDVLNRVPPLACVLRPAVRGWGESTAITEGEEEGEMGMMEGRERNLERVQKFSLARLTAEASTEHSKTDQAG